MLALRVEESATREAAALPEKRSKVLGSIELAMNRVEPR